MRQIVQRREIFLRIHADRRRIQYDLDVARDVAAAVYGDARVRHGLGDLLLERGGLFQIAAGDSEVRALARTVVRHDGCRAAVAEQQDLFAAQRHTVAYERLGKAEDVGIVADGLSVAESDRVDRMQVARGGIHPVEQLDDRLFVRNGAVDAGELFFCEVERFGKIIGRNRDADVRRVLTRGPEQLRVQLGTHRMAEWPAEQRVGWLFRPECPEFLHGKQHFHQPPSFSSVVKKSG